MEIIDRYLKTLKSGLPAEQREDIIREFSESIQSEMEEKEAELGRPLVEADVEALLRRRGNPLAVASRYRQDQRSLSFGRQLIGPMLFPYYMRVLKFNLGLTSVVILIILAALFAGGKTASFGGALGTLFWNLLLQFSIITGIFAAMDSHLTKNPDRWDIGMPRAPHFPGLLEGKEEGPRVPRMESVSQLIMLMVGLVWLRAVRYHPFLIFGPAALFLRAAPVWRELYLPVVFIALLCMAQSGVNLIRPDWVWLRSYVRLTVNGANVVLYYVLIRPGVWVVAAPEATEGYRQAVIITNQVIFYSLIAAAVVAVVQFGVELRRLINGTAGTVARKAAANS